MAPGKKLSPSKRSRENGEGGTGVKQTTLNFQSIAGQGQSRSTRAGSRAAAKVAAVRGLVGRGLAGPQGAPAVKRLTRGATAADKTVATVPHPCSKGGASPPKKPKPAAKPKQAVGKAGRGQVAVGPSSKARRQLLSEVEREEEVFRAGDIVYVVLDDSLELGEQDVEACCVVCGSEEKEEVVMLECDNCLNGWHLACLDPPLQEVPEGNWLCPNCSAGKPPPPRPATCACEKFLQQQGLGLARIEALWRGGDGEERCTLRWYNLPEETHRGRQKHRPAREVFLTQLRTEESVDSLLLSCYPRVLPEAEFFRGATGQGEDVFLCEYEYDTLWQRFRRHSKFDSGDEGEEEDYTPSDDDEQGEEVRDKTFKPTDAFRAGKGPTPANKARGRRKKIQGGDVLLERVGALEIHDQVARRRRAHEGSGPAAQLAKARDELTLTRVPKTLPCREKERREVEAFVQDVLDDSDATGCGKCLYVSGIPGTGKTATVLEVMRGFRQRAADGSAPRHQFVEINGLRLPSPQHAYSALYEAMTGDRVGPQAAVQLLDGMMGKAAKQHTIVLVDEMDMLVNKTQTVLYNLFDWPGRKGSRLSIIGVANTMDLPQRLHPRIGSRLAGRSVVFHPYTNEQLQQIIQSRLAGLPAFKDTAVRMVSLKVANCSGDVRRCLELCRRAAEIAEEKWVQQQRKRQQQGGSTSSGASSRGADESSGLQEGEKEESGVVEMRHVNMAVQEMFNTSHVIMIRTASRLERLLLAALHTETRRTGRAEALLEDVAERLRTLCQNNMERQYEFGAVMETAVRLGSKRLVLCDPGVKRLKMKMSLNVPTNDLLNVLRNDDQIAWLAERLVD